MRRSARFPHSQKRKHRRASLLVLLGLVLLWSACMGWMLARSADVSLAASPLNQVSQVPATSLNGTVDPIPQKYQLGAELYLKNCATCHIGLPPEVLPSETWRRLLMEPSGHYGKQVAPIQKLQVKLIWQYLRAFSRPLREEEALPFRMERSRFFKALHPRVDLPRTIRPNTCASCHPGASNYDFRRLTPEWETAN